MDDGRMPKDILYAELKSGKRQTGRPLLHYKDVCKQDLKSYNINQPPGRTLPKIVTNGNRLSETGCRPTKPPCLNTEKRKGR